MNIILFILPLLSLHQLFIDGVTADDFWGSQGSAHIQPNAAKLVRVLHSANVEWPIANWKKPESFSVQKKKGGYSSKAYKSPDLNQTEPAFQFLNIISK